MSSKQRQVERRSTGLRQCAGCRQSGRRCQSGLIRRSEQGALSLNERGLQQRDAEERHDKSRQACRFRQATASKVEELASHEPCRPAGLSDPRAKGA